MGETNWMGQLTVGDKVIVSTINGTDAVHSVHRCLPTQIVIATKHGEIRFSKKHGHKMGEDHWDTSSLMPWTLEAQDEILRQQALRHLWRQVKAIELKHIQKLSRLQCAELKNVLDDFGLLQN